MPEEVKPEEKQDLIASAKALPLPEGGFSLRPRNFDEAYRFANLMASSDLVPKDFKDKPANVLVAVQLGMELGVSPMQALQNICVINGRPTIWGDLLPALVLQSGLLEAVSETGDDKMATCTVTRRGFAPISRTFSIEEARRAELLTKDPWKKYPARMLQMRARAFAYRDMFADVLKGLQIREEVEDFTESRDVTPLKEPRAIEDNSNGTQNADTAANVSSVLSNDAGAAGAAEKPNGADRKAAALFFIEESPDADFTADKDWLAKTIKGMSQSDQLDVVRSWNARNRKIGDTATKDA